jgi:RNA methyltransferase, TrmH family
MMLTSLQSPVLKKIRKALSQGGLTEDGLAVTEGPKLISEALESGCKVQRLLAVEGVDVDPAFGEVTEVSAAVFREIKGTEHSQGLLALVEAPVWTLRQVDKNLVLVLDAIQDPGNAGTIIRTAEAFGATAVVMLKGCVDPWNPKCLRASAGSLFRMPVVVGVSDVSELENSAWYEASGHGGATIDVVDWSPPVVLVIGNEGRGVSPEVAVRCRPVTIPTSQVESLNAAVAAAVILYEAQRWKRNTLLVS